MTDLATLTADYNRKVGRAQELLERAQRLEVVISDESRSVDLYTRAALLLTALGGRLQDASVASLERLTTLGLQSVFGEGIEFKVESTVRNKVTTYDFKVAEASGLSTDLESSRGGGLVAVAGVVLRLVFLRMLAPRGQRQVVFLDEPLAHLSAEYLPAAAELIRRLSQELDIQVVMVTHQPELAGAADMVHRFAKRSGQVVVTTEEACTP